MPTLDWHCRRIGGVTLVELVVESEGGCHVRIDSELSPVWPPRSQGVPVAGWDGTAYETTLEAGDRQVIGFASPAEPTDPPATLETLSPQQESSLTPHQLVRALGGSKPPRDAVPRSETETHTPRPAVSVDASNTDGPPRANEDSVTDQQRLDRLARRQRELRRRVDALASSAESRYE